MSHVVFVYIGKRHIAFQLIENLIRRTDMKIVRRVGSFDDLKNHVCVFFEDIFVANPS